MSGKTLLLIILAPTRDVFASAILWLVIVFPFFLLSGLVVKYVLARIVTSVSFSGEAASLSWIRNKLNF